MDQNESVVLVDLPEGAPFDAGFLEGVGHRVVVCHGPDHGTQCPVLAGTRCELADSAHGIVFSLDLDKPQHRTILSSYKKLIREDVPIRVVVSQEQSERFADLLKGVQVWTHDPGAGDLDGFAATVEAADRFRDAED